MMKPGANNKIPGDGPLVQFYHCFCPDYCILFKNERTVTKNSGVLPRRDHLNVYILGNFYELPSGLRIRNISLAIYKSYESHYSLFDLIDY